MTYPTSLGVSTPTQIRLLGQDLSEDLIGSVGFGELAFWLVALRRPSPSETRLFEACLVALADHGFTPTAIAARLTYLSAPDALQGALAAGLLGGGSRFLGVTEDTGAFLAEALAEARASDALPEPDADDAAWDALAVEAVERQTATGSRVPGLGHHLHKQRDPRVARLYAVAQEEHLVGPHLRLFAAVGRVAGTTLGKDLPLNGAGAVGAALADLGLPVELLRGFALLARTAGLLGHLAEETRHPIAGRIFAAVEDEAEYVPPEPPEA
ncbi:citryl-CoA lyase [Xylanimonas sp. McL0601]|uniref:citryl-CoA lyase n=1 Tax=Xylanimonas sp. McL0601 TaxID=3414739 RepID=UPI003CF2DC3E